MLGTTGKRSDSARLGKVAAGCRKMVEGVSRMREIKFRAWHKKQKRWIKFMSIVWGDFGSPNPDE